MGTVLKYHKNLPPGLLLHAMEVVEVRTALKPITTPLLVTLVCKENSCGCEESRLAVKTTSSSLLLASEAVAGANGVEWP